MSGAESDGEGSSGNNFPAVQQVGYGKPPVEHRFQKGRSGNPGGRPKRATNKPKVNFDGALQPTDNLILEEAYRPVTIREGGRTIELPAIQAAVRALAISAMTGSRLSQRALAELVRTVENRKSEERLTMMENAFEYKQKWSEELARRKRSGVTEPDPIPHPEDIIIDMRTGQVTTEGPLDELEKKDWDQRLARRDEAQDEVRAFAQKHRSARSREKKVMWRLEWHFEQRIFDIINDSMPLRYKVKLNDRSCAEGASREGKALEEFRRDQRKTRSRRGAR